MEKNVLLSMSTFKITSVLCFFAQVNIEVTRGYLMSNIAECHFYLEMRHYLITYYEFEDAEKNTIAYL